MAFRYVYGPVPFPRLGRSLGVNPIPMKACNHSCVYCQSGRTPKQTNTREDFFPPEEVQEEIRQAVDLPGGDADSVTFVGEGEPTLCQSIGRLIDFTKEVSSLPVAVITNGGLFSLEDVRNELARADVVMPSLDAAEQETYEKVNRPHDFLKIAETIDGMARFRALYRGQLWMESIACCRDQRRGGGPTRDPEGRGPDRTGPVVCERSRAPTGGELGRLTGHGRARTSARDPRRRRLHRPTGDGGVQYSGFRRSRTGHIDDRPPPSDAVRPDSGHPSYV